LKKNSAKQMQHEKRKLSLTVKSSLRKTGDKHYDEGRRSPVEKAGPREHAARLAQWFAIANGTAKSPLKLPGGVVFDLTPAFFEPLQRSVLASLDRLVSTAEMLRTDPGWLGRYRRVGAKSAGSLHIAWESAGAQGGEFWGDLAIGLDGHLIHNPGNLRALFVDALRGAELARFKRCPICKQFFYALRAKTESGTDTKACSKVCNNRLGVRRWREDEYRRTLDAGELDRNGKSLHEIARSLGVSLARARQYVQGARKIEDSLSTSRRASTNPDDDV
jgi:hypothetical protein